MLRFFNQNFSRHLVELTGDDVADATAALSRAHPLAKGGTSRFSSGWAVVTEQGAAVQLKLAVPGLRYSDQTRYEGFLDALRAFDGRPLMLLEFDKRPVPVANVHRTFDLRAVRVCSPKGVETFDFTLPPQPKGGTKTQRNLWKAQGGR
jgi:hypothetical protein